MDYTRKNKRVFVWADSKSGTGCKNYIFTVKEKFRQVAQRATIAHLRTSIFK